MRHKDVKDHFTGKALEIGHIVAVRYVWSSYVGIIRLQGLSLWESAKRFAGAAPYHSLENDKTYQILGHVNSSHVDYNEAVFKWLNSSEGDCPVNIRVYENMKILE